MWKVQLRIPLALRNRLGFKHWMTRDSLLNDDWNRTIERLGGAEALAAGARETKAFAWGRKIATPVVLLRLVLAYCLGDWSLRSTATWATAVGLVDISNVGLLYRLRRCGDWLAPLVGDALAAYAPERSAIACPGEGRGAADPDHRCQFGTQGGPCGEATQWTVADP